MIRLWKSTSLATLLGVCLLLPALPAGADTLEMPPGPAALDESNSITLPGRGMTMVAVEERFGQPSDKYNEVGDPPITRWVYPDFTVYFEYQYVINAVPHDQAARP
jgi:hypothetical protein